MHNILKISILTNLRILFPNSNATQLEWDRNQLLDSERRGAAGHSDGQRRYGYQGPTKQKRRQGWIGSGVSWQETRYGAGLSMRLPRSGEDLATTTPPAKQKQEQTVSGSQIVAGHRD